jgi:hypothetical protein
MGGMVRPPRAAAARGGKMRGKINILNEQFILFALNEFYIQGSSINDCGFLQS